MKLKRKIYISIILVISIYFLYYLSNWRNGSFKFRNLEFIDDKVDMNCISAFKHTLK